MFALRTISSDGVETNTVIGDSYSLITRRSKSDFECTARNMFIESDEELEKVNQFIHSYDHEVIVVYKDEEAYIMLGSGKTYDNLTYVD